MHWEGRDEVHEDKRSRGERREGLRKTVSIITVRANYIASNPDALSPGNSARDVLLHHVSILPQIFPS